MNHKKSKIPQFVPVGALALLLCLTSAAQAAAPVIREAKVVTSTFIELDWQGMEYIQNAGRSKERTSATDNNFEVRLNNNILALQSPPSWYWNINNYSLHGVRVNQNKTTLRLSSALSGAQLTAIQNGTSTLTVRITSADVTGADGTPANTATVYPVVNKPYYDKTVVSKSGVPVRGSEFVLERTVQQAADMVDVILSAMPENVLSSMRTRNQFVIFGPGEHSYNIPEHRSIFLTDAWNRAEGYGGNTAATSAANVERHHNIPAAQRPYESAYASGYRNESILAHEFGHGVHSGMTTALRNELQSIYNSARETPENPANPTGRMKWDNSYAGGNASEYIATATATWFDAMNETQNWGGTYGPLNYREELRRYDTPFYNFLSRIYPETRTLSTAWGSGIPNSYAPAYAPEPAEPAGKYGPSVKIKSTAAANPAGSGLNAYAAFGSSISASTPVELWWDVNTDLMRWHLQPDADESYFRIQKKGSNLVLMPTGSAATAATRIVLAAAVNSDESQWWELRRRTNGDGSFTIINKSNPQLVLAPESNAAASGTRVMLASGSSGFPLYWMITDGDVPLEQRITAVAALNDIAVPVGTQTPLQQLLPGTVSATINSIRSNAANTPVYGTMNKNINVDWGITGAEYNPNVSGTYTFSGVPRLEGLLTNPDRRTASVTVRVGATGTASDDNRVIPPGNPAASQDKPVESAAVMPPVSVLAGEFTAGPNPAAKSSGAIKIYRQGGRVGGGVLTVYDVSGNFIRKVAVSDDAAGVPRATPAHPTGSRRVVGSWDLKDAKGRTVTAGTYLVRGTITVNGKKEHVSMVLGVR